MSISHTGHSSGSYDNDILKQIPIIDVAHDMGLKVTKKGKNYWCSARPDDKTPSTILHPDTNTYKDFGGEGRGGDVIDFVGYVLGKDYLSSKEWLAERYSIKPSKSHGRSSRKDLLPWEYEKIGLYSDRATKNFIFDFDRLPIDTIKELSDRYAMPMNELRQKHPKIYASILIQKAIPHVNAMRNNYYLSVWASNELFKEMNCGIDFFEEQCRNHFFDTSIKELENAEKILYRAGLNTKLKIREPQSYDPIKDLASMKEGALKPQLGTLTYRELQQRSKDNKSPIQYTRIELAEYESNAALEDFPHNAFMSKGSVFVGYLESDSNKLQSIFDAHNESFDEKILKASQQANYIGISKPDMMHEL